MNNTLQFMILLEPYRDALYELHRVSVIACSLPATSAGCERSFSKLKLIKTYLRNRMDDGRLSNLGMISLNGPELDGDAARRALDTALYRLRRLLPTGALQRGAVGVTLNPAVVQVERQGPAAHWLPEFEQAWAERARAQS